MTSKRILEIIEEKRSEQFMEAVNGAKISRHITTQLKLDRNLDEIQKIIDAYEVAIVIFWRHAFDTTDKVNKASFHESCRNCFDLLQMVPAPSKHTDKIKHILKMFAYAYLGEKWEDMRRFLIENEVDWTINTEADQWDVRLLSKIYMAVLYMVRKETWNDLSRATEYVKELQVEQKEYEERFFAGMSQDHQGSAALEIASYYHLALAVDILCRYMLNGGGSRQVISKIDYHMDTASRCCERSMIVELELLIMLLQAAFRKMVENSIWSVASQINSRATKFVKSLTRRDKKPIFELLYPQRSAILEQRLLDPALKAVVVNLPTSSGKTIIAEFRILQALNQFAETGGKIVYVVPTRALVNQITTRLRRDLGQTDLGVRIEKMSGAIEIDSFEKNVLESGSFDVLVTTPEKMNLLVRAPENKKFVKDIVLAVIDEAHNISNKSRGLNWEMLISNIQRDCERAHLLLMTPFIPNHKEVAQWLDPFNPQSIHMELDWWQPNDKVVGLYYADDSDGGTNIYFQPVVTHSNTLTMKQNVVLGHSKHGDFRVSMLRNNNSKLSALTASMMENQSTLILSGTVPNTWSIAKHLDSAMPDVSDSNVDQNLDLVARYVESEMGRSFPLAGYVRKGIGVHHAGLPDDVRELMEWLMESGSLKVLVSTTTVVQGMNFPINNILISSYKRRMSGPMPPMEFWNIVGRAGRLDQRSLGMVGVAVHGANSDDAIEAKKYVLESTGELVSVLKNMIEDATRLGKRLNLSSHANEPKWSSFLQYLSHMYSQSDNIEEFIAEISANLNRTYGYTQLSPKKKENLAAAVREYADYLSKNEDLVTLSDKTGFTIETLQTAIDSIQEFKIEPSEWGSNLFSGESSTLAKLTGILLEKIPETSHDLSEIKGSGNQNEFISRVISDWVSGKAISAIAQKYFGGTDPAQMSTCVRAIYAQISHSATWGLAALQKLPTSGIRTEEMSEEEKQRFANIPAMVYYGVDTNEAILMRLNSVPRSISKKIGEMYKNERPDFYNVGSRDVTHWLQELVPEDWGKAVPKDSSLLGGEYKQIWALLSGVASEVLDKSRSD